MRQLTVNNRKLISWIFNNMIIQEIPAAEIYLGPQVFFCQAYDRTIWWKVFIEKDG